MNSKVTATILLLAWMGCAQQRSAAVAPDAPIAFPGAEGFGKHATGGRGGKVFVVNNTNDHGPGSLRQALSSDGPRIIVFAVSGTIHLESKLNIKSNTTIAGQTAPGDGICIADHPVSITGDNIIIRYMRFRLGDKNQNEGMVDGSGSDDALGGIGRKNIIIDHCSISWSTDEVLTVYNGDSSTLQWNIIAEPLNYSYHFETGDKDFEHHGYGGIWGGRHLSAHHNLFVHCLSRNPRFAGIRSIDNELVDYRNNVIYNWGHNNVYGGEGGNYNIVNNYYKYGPSTNKNVRFRIVNPSKDSKLPYGKYYVHGNYVDGAPSVTDNNWEGVHMGGDDKAATKKPDQHEVLSIAYQSAPDAYVDVLKYAGASLPVRDTLDERLVQNVNQRTGRIIDVQGGHPHGTPYAVTVTAWPELRTYSVPVDTDQDGIPDEWEKKNGLNPTSAHDAVSNSLGGPYSNIEWYINSLVPSR